jgi:hypothetical protein
MKILRSVTRRGFHMGTAGWFTVLRPNTWFPATRLHDGTHHLPRRSRSVLEPQEWNGNSEKSRVAPRIITLNGHDPRLLRRAFIILAAITITSLLLLWIIRPY